jgi:hypothetical protein
MIEGPPLISFAVRHQKPWPADRVRFSEEAHGTKRCNGLAGSVLSDGSSSGREPLIAIVRHQKP